MDKDIKSIEVRDLVKKFGDFTAVNDISFHVFKGEIFGFLGANGAGKTTAMRILCGLSHPTSGEGSVAGFSIVNEQEKIKKHIGYMSQKFSLYPDLKVWENIELELVLVWAVLLYGNVAFASERITSYDTFNTA